MTGARSDAAIPWRDVAVLAAVALAVRVAASSGREIWYDDVYRVRDATLGWGEIWTHLPELDNQKSPYLVGLHKAFVSVTGTGSILAIRGWGILTGTLLVVAASLFARAAAGRTCGLVVGAYYAVDPFFLRWSAEVHNYTPAALAAAAAWALALRRDVLAPRDAAIVGALTGLAVAIFPPTAVAVAPLVLVRAVRSMSPVAWAAALASAAVVVLPAAVSIHRSREFLAAALEAGPGPRLRQYHYSPRWTPVEVLARMGGLDLRQGRGTAAIAACVATVLGCVVAKRLLDRRADRARGGASDALLAAGLVPLALCLALGGRSRPFVYDRYAATILAFLPAAAIAGLWHRAASDSSTLRRRIAAALGAAGGAVLAWALVSGGIDAVRMGASFPKEVTAHGYRGTELLERELAARPAPVLVAAHGEGQFMHAWIRTRVPETVRPLLGHFASEEWARVARAGDRTPVAIEPAFGWPHGIAHLAGRDVTVDRVAVRRRVAGGERVWILLENTLPPPTWYLAEEQEREGFREIRDLAAEPASRERDDAVRALARRYLGLADGTPVGVSSLGRALLLRLGEE